MKHYWMTLVAAGLVGTTSAYGGTKFQMPISITINADGSGRMSGTLGSTRNTPDQLVAMNCAFTVALFAGTITKTATCWGNDLQRQLMCNTHNPDLVDAAGRVTGDSQLVVEVDNNGNCVTIQVQAASWAPPKAP